MGARLNSPDRSPLIMLKLFQLSLPFLLLLLGSFSSFRLVLIQIIDEAYKRKGQEREKEGARRETERREEFVLTGMICVLAYT